MFLFPLGRRNGFFVCKKGRLGGRNAEGARTSFLDAGWTCKMDPSPCCQSSTLSSKVLLLQISEVERRHCEYEFHPRTDSFLEIIT